ncbi:hypothetical protein AFLA_003601 [Aspergillus flavus NRRL3357]|nr:hypothetical protein AFLA_003601 [Aspergillus flavus NRRL3357]
MDTRSVADSAQRCGLQNVAIARLICRHRSRLDGVEYLMDASYADVVRDQRRIGTLFIKGAIETLFSTRFNSTRRWI